MSWQATDADLAVARTFAAEVKRRGGQVTLPVDDLLERFEIGRFTIASRQRLAEALASARLTADPPIRRAARSGSVTIVVHRRRWYVRLKGGLALEGAQLFPIFLA